MLKYLITMLSSTWSTSTFVSSLDSWFQLCLTMLSAAKIDNKSGMMAKVHTRIRSDPFSANYELAGKELGR